MSEEYVSVKIPRKQYDLLKAKFDKSLFSDVEDYIIWVLGEIVSETENDERLSESDKELVDAELAKLGYL